MVAFDSSSPTHQPPGCCSSSRRLVAASIAASSRVELGGGRSLPPSARARRARRCGRRPPSSPASRWRPGAGADDVRAAGLPPGARRPRPGAIVACGSRLTRDQRSSASPSRSVSGAAISSTSSRPRTSSSSGAPLDDDGQVLAALGAVAGQRAAVEDPVRAGCEQRGERRAQQRPVEQQMDADDRRVLERRAARRAGAPLSPGGTARTTASASTSSSELDPRRRSDVAPAAWSARPAASPCISPSGRAGRIRSASLGARRAAPCGP